jgi:hypothetical protein
MDDGDGAFTLELQAAQIAKNQTMYKGSAPCPQCGVMVNPVEFMYNKGLCIPCLSNRSVKRIKNRMSH